MAVVTGHRQVDAVMAVLLVTCRMGSVSAGDA
jgi:hypothetical protein